MAINPKFYLRKPNANESSIYMGLRLSPTELFKYTTSLNIYPELFDKSTQRPTNNTRLINEYAKVDPNIKSKIKVISTTLNNLETDTLSIINDLLRFNKVVSSTELKQRLDEIYNPSKTDIKKLKVLSFNNYLRDFISRCEDGRRLNGSKHYTKGTIKTYKTFQNTIDKFKLTLTFENIDMKFYEDFVQFLNKKNYALNSIGKNIKFVKVIAREAMEKGFHNNLVYTHKDFRTVYEETDSVYLTEKELDNIYNLDLTTKPNYELARDVFLVGCYTALRFSDYSRIKGEHIKERNGRHFLEMYTQKTNTLVKIPLKPRVFDILRKYDMNLPKTYEQKVNAYIKEVCKMVNITEIIETTATFGGILITKQKPKYEMVKTHTARRTGATLLYLAGVAPIDIMKITGHSKETNLLKYICITKEQTADRLAENKFFQ